MLFNSTCEAYDNPVSYFYNKTGKPISPNWRTHDFIVVGLGLPICVFIILANMLVIVAIIINRQFHFPIYYLLGNMAAADLFAGISYLYLVFHTGPWTIGLTIKEWFIRGALVNMSLTASVVNLLAVAVERHQTIFTMQLHSTMTRWRVVMLIVSIWLVAVVMGFVPTMGWNCVCDLSTCCTVAPLYSRSFLVSWAILNLMAFFIMVAVYAHIFIYVHRRSRVMSPHTDQPSNNQTVISLMKTMSMILGKALTSGVCEITRCVLTEWKLDFLFCTLVWKWKHFSFISNCVRWSTVNLFLGKKLNESVNPKASLANQFVSHLLVSYLELESVILVALRF